MTWSRGRCFEHLAKPGQKKTMEKTKNQPTSKADRMKKGLFSHLGTGIIKEGGRCGLKPGIIACVGDSGIAKTGNLFHFPKFGGFNTLFVQMIFLPTTPKTVKSGNV